MAWGKKRRLKIENDKNSFEDEHKTFDTKISSKETENTRREIEKGDKSGKVCSKCKR